MNTKPVTARAQVQAVFSMPARGGENGGQGVVKLQNQPAGPVQVIQKQVEISSRTGKILVRDMQTGKFAPKS